MVRICAEYDANRERTKPAPSLMLTGKRHPPRIQQKARDFPLRATRPSGTGGAAEKPVNPRRQGYGVQRAVSFNDSRSVAISKLVSPHGVRKAAEKELIRDALKRLNLRDMETYFPQPYCAVTVVSGPARTVRRAEGRAADGTSRTHVIRHPPRTPGIRRRAAVGARVLRNGGKSPRAP